MGRIKGSKNKPKIEPIIINDEPIVDMTTEVSEAEIQRAQKLNLPDPDFDFRRDYEKNDHIYYVYVNEFDGTKEVFDLIVRTIYARTLIAYEDGGMCRCIGHSDSERVFRRRDEAERECQRIKVTAMYS